MTDLKKMLAALSSLMGTPGYEAYDADALRALVLPYFDAYESDNVNNHIFIKRCGQTNAPKLLIDTHYDEIGMIVSGIFDGGFLSVAATGGMDRRTMPAGEVTVWGKNREQLYGVIVSTPPHLASGDRSKLPAMTEFRIDTGYDREVLEQKVELGAPVTMIDRGCDLLGGYVSGKAFDNRSSVAAAVAAIADIDAGQLAYDVILAVSAKEETGMNGPKMVAFRYRPDLALVVDVNIARTPGVDADSSVKCGDGAAISLSAVTDRRLTRRLIDLAAGRGIRHQTVVEATGTGTNAEALTLVGAGVPVAVAGVPLKRMHMPTETLLMSDLEALRDLLAAAVTSEKLL